MNILRTRWEMGREVSTECGGKSSTSQQTKLKNPYNNMNIEWKLKIEIILMNKTTDAAIPLFFFNNFKIKKLFVLLQ